MNGRDRGGMVLLGVLLALGLIVGGWVLRLRPHDSAIVMSQ